MEWSNAQEITFRVDLFAAAKQELRFLSVVDSAGCLYDGPALDRAIYRYKNCWLPLLAKHMEASVVVEGPLVVPFDCEWIWHCHRLNPLQYKHDCEEIYGKILETWNVVSTVEKASTKQSESVWNNIYVTEPYNLDLTKVELFVVAKDESKVNGKFINYDLVAAVQRQSTFFGKVSKEMKGLDVDDYLKAAVARYKAFLHMIKAMKKTNPDTHGVPTREIDLIWHTHQLNPLAYCQDLMSSVGVVLDHNDRDIGTSEGKKMAQIWFAQTQKIWEESFGNKYLVAGAGGNKRNMVEDSPECACAGSCSYNCVEVRSVSVEDSAPGCSCAGSCSYNCVEVRSVSVEANALEAVANNGGDGGGRVCNKQAADNLGGLGGFVSTVAAAN